MFKRSSVQTIELKKSYLDMSQLCKSVDKDTSCHPQMRGNRLGYSGTPQKPPRLNPTMNWKLMKHQHYCPQYSQFYIVMD